MVNGKYKMVILKSPSDFHDHLWAISSGAFPLKIRFPCHCEPTKGRLGISSFLNYKGVFSFTMAAHHIIGYPFYLCYTRDHFLLYIFLIQHRSDKEEEKEKQFKWPLLA
jgi:hypothetical protein